MAGVLGAQRGAGAGRRAPSTEQTQSAAIQAPAPEFAKTPVCAANVNGRRKTEDIP